MVFLHFDIIDGKYYILLKTNINIIYYKLVNGISFIIKEVYDYDKI